MTQDEIVVIYCPCCGCPVEKRIRKPKEHNFCVCLHPFSEHDVNGCIASYPNGIHCFCLEYRYSQNAEKYVDARYK